MFPPKLHFSPRSNIPANTNSAHWPACSKPTAFSLVELLVVIAIISICASFGTPALLSSMRASSLNKAGNQIGDMANLARQNAINRNSATALVLVTDAGDSSLKNRVIGLLELDQDQVWRQIGTWFYLPESVRIEDSGTPPYVTLPLPPGATVQMNNVRGKAVAAYQALVFLPNGMLYGETNLSRTWSAVLVANNQRIQPENYYDLIFNTETSVNRVARP